MKVLLVCEDYLAENNMEVLFFCNYPKEISHWLFVKGTSAIITSGGGLKHYVIPCSPVG